MSAQEPVAISRRPSASSRADSKGLVQDNAANELVFAVVGHVGSGPSFIARWLRSILGDAGYETKILKATDILSQRGGLEGFSATSIERAKTMQGHGDDLRQEDPAAVARALALRIRETRAEQMNLSNIGNAPVKPDAGRRAYILDSLKHPAEVELLRRVYQSSFLLIGIACDYEKRLTRLTSKYRDAGKEAAEEFMSKDEKSRQSHGQQVADTFHLADAFIDNSSDERRADREPNKDWKAPTDLTRIVRIVTHSHVVRPYPAETAMHAAYAAQTQSACLSRQVGAALIDKHGNLVSTGTNEVPRAGGGVYGEDPSAALDSPDHRCAYKNKYCSSTREQHNLVDDIVARLEAHGGTVQSSTIRDILLSTRITQVLEFSRAVHAEMDALLGAARMGHSTVGTRLFVTTFPCHYCARHIVASGVDEVQYIEPYSKSRAKDLHSDSISLDAIGWTPPSASNDGQAKVLFRPFVGIAPRLYRRAFFKDRDLKDKAGEMKIHAPDWGSPWQVLRVSYADLEALLLRADTNGLPATNPQASPKPPAQAVVHELPRVLNKKDAPSE
ncbi:MAG: anti-phage dCTP deaminase [Kofleriaceae bacterium]